MARISAVVLREEQQHYLLALRRTIDFADEFARFAQESFSLTAALLEQRGVLPLGGPVIQFYNADLTRLDVEAGWQVADFAAGYAGIRCNRVPRGRVVTAIDQGPYEEQDPTYMDLLGWAQEQNLITRGPLRYCYLNDTERPAAHYLTEMALPVE